MMSTSVATSLPPSKFSVSSESHVTLGDLSESTSGFSYDSDDNQGELVDSGARGDSPLSSRIPSASTIASSEEWPISLSAGIETASNFQPSRIRQPWDIGSDEHLGMQATCAFTDAPAHINAGSLSSSENGRYQRPKPELTTEVSTMDDSNGTSTFEDEDRGQPITTTPFGSAAPTGTFEPSLLTASPIQMTFGPGFPTGSDASVLGQHVPDEQYGVFHQIPPAGRSEWDHSSQSEASASSIADNETEEHSESEDQSPRFVRYSQRPNWPLGPGAVGPSIVTASTALSYHPTQPHATDFSLQTDGRSGYDPSRVYDRGSIGADDRSSMTSQGSRSRFGIFGDAMSRTKSNFDEWRSRLGDSDSSSDDHLTRADKNRRHIDKAARRFENMSQAAKSITSRWTRRG